MCGIAGEVRRREQASTAIVGQQLTTLLHRGPDSVGTFGDGRGVIGQTRLAVIDLVSGDPPVTNPGRSVGAALNGEIYNFRALRHELAARGHALHTTGDTEVLVHLAEELEPTELAARLHGMFAFATWDSARERLVLGRDRLGKKPLYWWCDGSTFVFGSEIKSLLANPAVTAELDEDAIPAYLAFGYVPSPRTFYRGIMSVPPGHVLTLDAATLEPDIRPYWRPPIAGVDRPALDIGRGDAAREVRRLLGEAVRDRLVADVPVGAFLSGGIDSSAVVALMAEAGPVRTFTIGFEDARFDERSWANQVAERFGTEHTEFVVRPDAVELVEQLVWHHDQPFGDSSGIPTYLLSEMTRKEVTVALCGDGGDELFAGYERFLGGMAAARLRRVPPPLLTAAGRVPGLPANARRFLATAGRGLPDGYRSWVGFFPDELVDELSPGTSRWALRDYEEVWRSSAGASTLDRLLDLNLRTYLVDDLLPKVDRTSMAVALEVRAPFLDHRLVEYALALPPSTKVRGLKLKQVLKDAFVDDLPAELLARPKKGFGVPLDRWFREDLARYATSTLGDKGGRVRRHLRGPVIDRLLAEHASGRAARGQQLWALLTLEVFLRARDW